MIPVPALSNGYRTFRTETFPANRALYRDLVEHGQAPKVMIVACCDSRVDPTAIFSARPGELFIVRNVANLVPPYGPHGEHHGTSAALEFAVTGLEVEHVLVMGHAFCGGVKAFLDGLYGAEAGPDRAFIAKWMSLLRPAMGHLPPTEELRDPAARQRALERASVVNSLANLETFPFVKDRVAQGRLALHGAHFDIETGVLWFHDPARGVFIPLEVD